jgi:perosamine synthetase
LEPAVLSDADRDALADLLPAPEPQLGEPSHIAGSPLRALRVCEPLLDGNELRYLTECIATNWVSSAGPFVRRFDDAFSEAVGCEFGVSCSSGTAALHLIVAALGLGRGDEVIIPTFTMIATANAVTYTGADPVLVDADPITWNIDPHSIERAITPQTRAIVVVHTYGFPADMNSISDIAQKRGLMLIEDAAEAHGAAYAGRPVGSLADAAAFSFYGNKIVTTGEGGMVTTNDAALAERVRQLRDHAFSEDLHFWHSYRGFNYRMTNLQAAIGLAQVERLPELLARRKRVRECYDAEFAGVRGLRRQRESPNSTSVSWMYALCIDDEFGPTRDELRYHLAHNGIETRTAFVPMHLQPIYRERYRAQSFPVAEDLCRRGLYLPSGPTLTDDDVKYVAREVLRAQTRP